MSVVGDCLVTSLIYPASLFLSKSLYTGGKQTRKRTQEIWFPLNSPECCPGTLRGKESKARLVVVICVKCRFLGKGKPLWSSSHSFIWLETLIFCDIHSVLQLPPPSLLLLFASVFDHGVKFASPITVNPGTGSLESYVRDHLGNTSCYICHLSLFPLRYIALK